MNIWILAPKTVNQWHTYHIILIYLKYRCQNELLLRLNFSEVMSNLCYNLFQLAEHYVKIEIAIRTSEYDIQKIWHQNFLTPQYKFNITYGRNCFI